MVFAHCSISTGRKVRSGHKHRLAALGTDVQVASLNVTFTDIGCNGGRSMTPAPYIAVDDIDPAKVYVTYADEKSGGSGMDVYIVYSSDHGKTWQGPYRINDDTTGQQYNPAMSVANGQVGVSWIDRRNDPSDDCKGEMYSTLGTNFSGGTPSFTANLNIGFQSGLGSSDFSGNPNGPGDYTGNATFSQANATPSTIDEVLFPTHLDGDILDDGSTNAFEIYGALVQPPS